MALKNRSEVEPTLFIGLGGSGGKILGRLKKTFQHEFGESPDRESPVQFLLLDTDDFQKLDDTVKKSLNEQEEFLTISHFNPRHYIDEHRRDHRSDLHRWFDWDARPLLEDAFVRDGASRLRILGRLCFHRSYYQVEKILADKIARAKSARAYVQGGGQIRTTERPFRVVIIGSTCGGTGSGIFLDLVYLLNRLIRSSGSTPDVLGFLFLPFWFIDANRQIDTDLVPYYQANAWAFFEELNHVLLQPSRLAEIALDPGRPNGVDAEPARADYEPLKTVYLLDSEIPNVGRFHDPNDWNAYVAQAIFQVFLAPEEGNLESVFSNIKTKLAETDHRYGLKKRFAALGYADVRHPGGELQHFLAERAAGQYVRDHLLGRPDEARVAAAADELREGIERALRRRADAVGAAPEPQLALDAYTMSQGPTKQVAKLNALGKLDQHVKEAVAGFNAALPTAGDVRQAVDEAAALLSQRVGKLALGLRGELAVLERVFASLQADAAAAEAAPAPAEFSPGAEPLAGMQAIRAETSKAKNVFGRGGPSSEPSAYLKHLEALNQDLRDRAQAFKEARAAAVRTAFLQHVVGVAQGDEWQDPLADATHGAAPERSAMGRRRYQLERAVADLQAATGSGADRALQAVSAHESLTTRYFPPVRDPDRTWAHFRGQYAQVLAERQFDLDRAVRDLSPHLLADDERAADRNGQIRATLERLAGFFGSAFDTSLDVARALEAEVEAARVHAATGDDAAGEREKRLLTLRHNLYPLSAPCCRIDYSRLSRGDTTPTVFVAASNRSEADVQAMLRLPATPGVIDNDGSQLALLQAVYAFPTQAVAGMDALQRAYEARDRARSFPHIQREWNRKGLKVSRRGELSDAELLQFGRARAISELFLALSAGEEGGEAAPATGNGPEPRRVHLPGLRIFDEVPGSEGPYWLLRYERDPRDGQFHLRARGIEPLAGHHRVWRLAAESEDLQVLDLDQNIRHYIASPVRESHERLLVTDVHELERGDDRASFVLAYQGYGTRLDEIAAWHRAEGRRAEEELHARVARVLRQYAEDLAADEVPVP